MRYQLFGKKKKLQEINMTLWKRVLIGLIIGVILGVVLQEKSVYLKPLGDLFIRMIKMIMPLLIFFAIINGISSVQDTKALGRIGIKASFTYLLTTVFAIIIGLSIGIIFEPGHGVMIDFDSSNVMPADDDGLFQKISNILINIVPDNAIGSIAQGSVLQIVFFALFTGVTINKMDAAHSKRLVSIFQLVSQMVFKMVGMIMELSPIAACCLTAWVIGTQGIDILKNLLKLIGCAYLAFLIQYLVFGVLIKIWTGLSPMPFFKKSLEYQTIAFSTSSSKAALPTTIKVCQNKLGVSSMSSSFVLPLGASINMDGIAIYISLCALFFAQVTGKVLSISDYSLIIFSGTLGSIGGAGIPGGAIVMLPMVLGAVGLPVEGIALIAGIDRIIDMMRTTISITGDAAATICIDHSEGLLDKEVYNKSTIANTK